MTRSQKRYKLRCGQLRACLAGPNRREVDQGPFKIVRLHGSMYVYNTIAGNVIMKWRTSHNVIGIQYRATSHYRHILERPDLRSYSPYRPRITSSTQLSRHLGDVRRALGIPTNGRN